MNVSSEGVITTSSRSSSGGGGESESSRGSGSGRSGSDKRSERDSALMLILTMQDYMHGASPNILSRREYLRERNESDDMYSNSKFNHFYLGDAEK